MHMDMTELKKSRIFTLRERTFGRSSATVYRFILHLLLYIASLNVGFRLSREAHLFGVSIDARFLIPNNVSRFVIQSVVNRKNDSSYKGMLRGFPYEKNDNTSSMGVHTGIKSSRVHVGRHEVLIRHWPHPDPLETNAAHHLLDLVQEEQRRIYKPKESKKMLMITPTYVHAHQSARLTSLIHNMRVAPVQLLWIVVEAGGVSNETASLLSSSQLSYRHVGFEEPMPDSLEERIKLERQLRVEGLRFIREECLDGIVIFADDRNVYNLDFFDQVQTLEWVGIFSTGLLTLTQDQSRIAEDNSVVPLQGLACNSSEHNVEWHTPTEGAHEDYTVTDKSIYWAGYALNARLLCDEYDKPGWIKNCDALFNGNTSLLESPLDFVKDTSHIEVLDNCREDIFVWHVENNFKNGFPSRWTINPQVVIYSEPPPSAPPAVLLPADG